MVINFSTYFTKYLVSLTGIQANRKKCPKLIGIQLLFAGFVLAVWSVRGRSLKTISAIVKSSDRNNDVVACEWSFALFFGMFGVDALVSAIQLMTKGL